MLSNLFAGRRIVYLRSLRSRRLAERPSVTERITNAMVVPTMLARIVEAIGDGAE